MERDQRHRFSYSEQRDVVRARQGGDMDIVWAHVRSRIASRVALWIALSVSLWAADMASTMTRF